MKLLISDVDHTLVGDDRKFSERLIKAITEVNKEGNYFVLCSGRPTESLLISAQILNDKGAGIKYVSGYNGAEIMDITTKEIIADNGFNYDETKEVTEVVEALKLDYALYSKDKFHVTNLENPYVKDEQSIINFPVEKLKTVFQSPKVLIFVAPELNEKYRLELKAKLPNFKFDYSMPFFIEVTKHGISKATTLTELMKVLNIANEDTYGFGDGGNDRDLLKKAYHGIAVANAKAEVKVDADLVIESVDKDGVAKYLEENIIRDKGE